MMLQLEFVSLPFALLGHLAIWVCLFNRLHAFGLSCRVIKLLEKLILLLALAIPAGYAWSRLAGSGDILAPGAAIPVRFLLLGYLLCCWIAALWVVTVWTWRTIGARRPARLLSNDTRTVDVVKHLGRWPVSGWSAALLARLPGNEVFRLTINEKTLWLPQLAAELDGLTIAHLSDFHFSGRITRAFFDLVVDQASQLDVDLIALTGDLVENARYVGWISDTLGRLKSRFGTYYVLGNHDRRVRDIEGLRRRLGDSGLIDLGSRWLTVRVRGQPILLAGNERPWFGTGAALEAARPSGDEPYGLRVLLAHTPDQIGWARSAGFDLMLAGHTHGGQIRLPLIGPIVAPSRFGVKYAGGVYFEEPTLLHVSRGACGLQPVRFGCPPELTRLVLTGKAPAPQSIGASERV